MLKFSNLGREEEKTALLTRCQPMSRGTCLRSSSNQGNTCWCSQVLVAPSHGRHTGLPWRPLHLPMMSTKTQVQKTLLSELLAELLKIFINKKQPILQWRMVVLNGLMRNKDMKLNSYLGWVYQQGLFFHSQVVTASVVEAPGSWTLIHWCRQDLCSNNVLQLQSNSDNVNWEIM